MFGEIGQSHLLLGDVDSFTGHSHAGIFTISWQRMHSHGLPIPMAGVFCDSMNGRFR